MLVAVLWPQEGSPCIRGVHLCDPSTQPEFGEMVEKDGKKGSHTFGFQNGFVEPWTLMQGEHSPPREQWRREERTTFW